jgi:hypothetical protein
MMHHQLGFCLNNLTGYLRWFPTIATENHVKAPRLFWPGFVFGTSRSVRPSAVGSLVSLSLFDRVNFVFSSTSLFT